MILLISRLFNSSKLKIRLIRYWDRFEWTRFLNFFYAICNPKIIYQTFIIQILHQTVKVSIVTTKALIDEDFSFIVVIGVIIIIKIDTTQLALLFSDILSVFSVKQFCACSSPFCWFSHLNFYDWWKRSSKFFSEIITLL